LNKQPQKSYLFDNPKNVRRVIRGLLIACAILLGLDAIIHRHAVHPWEGLFGFYALYGFVSCVILVVLAKELRKFIIRREDYYDPLESEPTATTAEEDDA
jgi:hypothetical protein